MQKCKCGKEMKPLSMNGEGRFWCPKCGRHFQSYVCHDPIWLTPQITLDFEDLRKKSKNERRD